MAEIWNKLKERANVASSSGSEPVHVFFQQPVKLNDNVYQVSKPIGRPSVEIVFFHDFQLEQSDLKDAECHITTWLSRDKSELWLKWLLDEFPQARILTILYDASAKRTDYEGLGDMFLTCENLMQSMTGSVEDGIGQDGCPVVLVGHCLGGLVMKSLCILATTKINLNPLDKPGIRAVDNLLQNVKGLFFYATPHHGFKLADRYTEARKGELYEKLKTLNKDIERLNEDFRMLREKNEWTIFGIGESREITSDQEHFREIVVSETSTGYDVDRLYSVATNHDDVCRPVNRQDSSFHHLETFVAGVLKEVKPIQAHLVGRHVVGLETSVKSVGEKLRVAQRLAIVGIGGIGKTTLAKAVFDKISWDFEYTCFLDELKEKMTHRESPAKLRSEIIKGLKRRGLDVSESFQWSRLQGKKVLIILDDVDFKSQVKVMTESDGFSKESRLVVTSRAGGFLRQEDFVVHTAATLDLDDSKMLFCFHVFNQPDALQGYENLVTEFAEACAGLPLALIVCGKYLMCHQKHKVVWEEALWKVRKAVPVNARLQDGLWSVLSESYDSLALSEREMFLDVATYFSGKELKYAMKIWTMCSWVSYVHMGWLNLLDKCLVSEDEYGRIQMHEMLRLMGRRIAGDSRVVFDDISHISQLLELSKHAKATIKILSLGGDHLDSYHYVDASALSGLTNLEILHLNAVLPDGGVILPKLRCLRYEDPSNLRFDPDSSHSEETIAGLQSFISTQSLRFIMLNRLSLVALPNMFTKLQSLRYVAISGCRSLKELPESFVQLGALESLEIEGCDSLVTFSADFGELRRLRILSITACGSLKELPDSFVLLGALERLEILHCSNLEISLLSLHNLRVLQHLDILKCREITGIDGWYELSSNRSENSDDEFQWVLSGKAVLRSLSFQDLNSMLAIGDNDDGLLRGVWVSDGVSYCGNLANLPESLGQPQKVQRLHIRGCTKEVMDLQNFNKLQDLTIEDSALLELPKFSMANRKLQCMEIRWCHSLKALPDSLGQLDTLVSLKIDRCSNLQTLSDSLGHLSGLQSLNIVDCYSLEALPDSLGQLRALQRLEIGCQSLKALPDTVGQLLALQHLKIEGWALKALPDTLGQLQRLQCLEIRSWCHSFTALPENLGQLSALQHLEIGAQSLKALPHILGRLQNLVSLKVDGCSNLQTLPNSLGDLSGLQSLKIVGCASLEALPKNLKLLQQLAKLCISGCRCLKTLPESIGQLSGLRRLKIWNCRHLEALPNIFGRLQDLEELEIGSCRSLKTLPESICQLRGRVPSKLHVRITESDYFEDISINTLGYSFSSY